MIPSRDQIIAERSEVEGATWDSCTEGLDPEALSCSDQSATEDEQGICMNCGAEMDYSPMHPWCADCDE